jgi:hypothetical protein
MLGTNIVEKDWPACGEIDIMENVGFNPDVIHYTIHTKAYNHMLHTQKGTAIPVTKYTERNRCTRKQTISRLPCVCHRLVCKKNRFSYGRKIILFI